MERTVMELEAGNFDADDSDIKQRYDNQRQVPTMLKKRVSLRRRRWGKIS
jgi:hypothetical protein